MILIEQISSLMLANLKTDAETYFSYSICNNLFQNIRGKQRILLDKIFDLENLRL